MNGHEHYLAAQRLLSQASYCRSVSDPTPRSPEGLPIDPAVVSVVLARAQVHATLALAAAQAASTVEKYCGDSGRVTDWGQAIGWDHLTVAKP